MPLTPGTRLGPYEIVSRIGEGGMGEVWKAHDSRLNRDVAIKTSSAKFSERFEREARAIAALNHPHICQIYDVGPDYIVMELVDGAPVKGPLPLDQVLKLAIQLAGAIEAAHGRNITHRDLKPGNILLTKSGVKVLDFGLAKIEQAKAAAAGDETLSKALTQEGAIVGTLQYMAPEQLNGKPVDSRADLFSFGCVLYEMLTGKRSFDGATTASVIAAVLEREPPSVEGAAPASLDWLLKRCLAKDSEDRWQTARDLRAALERISVIATEAMNAPKASRAPVLAWAAVAVLALAAGALAFVHFREKPAEAPLVRFSIQPQDGFPAPPTPPAVSPDGKMVAFPALGGGKTQIWVRALDSLEAQPLPGTENAAYPSWSPDSKSIAFIAGGKLRRTDVAGGLVTTLADGHQLPAWGSGGVIVFSQSFSQGLKQVSANGGAVRDATRADPKVVAQRFPCILPDGKHFVYVASTSAEHAKLRIGTINADGKAPGEDVELPGEVDSFAEYSQGNLLYVKDSTLMARPFDASRLAWTGEAVPVAEEIRSAQTLQMMLFSVSPSGVLVYQRGRNRVAPALLDRAGKAVAAIGEAEDDGQIRLSPDGKTVAITQRDAASANLDIWMMDLARGVRTRFTFDPAPDGWPVWAPDGRNVVFASSRAGSIGDLYVKPADGSKTEELVYADKRQKHSTSFSRDGKFLAFTASGNGSKGFDIWILPDPLTPVKERLQRGDAAKPYPFLQTEFDEQQGQFSPDGHWLAYTSNESGQAEVYVTPFPGPGAKKQVSTAGGANPHWRGDGKELIYAGTGRQVMAAEIVSNADKIDVGKVAPLFTLAKGTALQDLSADGQHLLVLTPPDGEKAEPLTVVVNWAAGTRK